MKAGMKKAAAFLVDKRKILLCLFLALAAASLVLAGQVKINYDLAEYLPESSRMKQGMRLMEEEFGDIPETREYRRHLEEVFGKRG